MRAARKVGRGRLSRVVQNASSDRLRTRAVLHAGYDFPSGYGGRCHARARQPGSRLERLAQFRLPARFGSTKSDQQVALGKFTRSTKPPHWPRPWWPPSSRCLRLPNYLHSSLLRPLAPSRTLGSHRFVTTFLMLASPPSKLLTIMSPISTTCGLLSTQEPRLRHTVRMAFLELRAA